jgi:hypothetical protein
VVGATSELGDVLDAIDESRSALDEGVRIEAEYAFIALWRC